MKLTAKEIIRLADVLRAEALEIPTSNNCPEYQVKAEDFIKAAQILESLIIEIASAT